MARTKQADTRAPGGSVAGGALELTTFPRLMCQLAEQRPDDVAMQEKLYGIWQPITWSDYARRVEDFAHGLAGFGVERGSIVAVLGDNRPEWLIAELAAQSMGAAVVGIYPTSIGEELEHILAMSAARVVVVEDQEQVDKLLRFRDGVLGRQIQHVVFYDPHGLEQYDDPWLIDFTEVERRGRQRAEQQPQWFAQQVDQGRPDDIAVIYRNHWAHGQAIQKHLDRLRVPYRCASDSRGKATLFQGEPCVKLVTLHSSKGLEFESVYLMGLGQRVPEAHDAVTEARLLYVGMTRAMSRLVMTGVRLKASSAAALAPAG